MTRLFVIAFITAFGLGACKAPAGTTAGGVPSLDGAFERDTLVVQQPDGVRHEIDIYLALSNEQHRRGLMFVRNMPQNVGMLFVYDDSRARSMWMKNTYISLDMIFARADGSVSSVIHDTEPESLQSRGSVEPIAFVLELNAGTARRLSIDNNSRLIWVPNR